QRHRRRDYPDEVAEYRCHRRSGWVRMADAGGFRARHSAVDRNREPDPFPWRVLSRHRARESHQGSATAREYRERAVAFERLAADHDWRRRYGIFRDETRATRGWPDSSRSVAENDRERP